MHKYQKELSDEKQLIEETYKKYFKDSQKHPKYLLQWQEFWSMRSKALIKIGCDPQKYDFKSEWKDYFFKYLKIIKEKDYAEAKKLLYEKYSKLYKQQLKERNRRSGSRSLTKYSYNRQRSRDSSYNRRSYSRSPARSRKNRSRSRSRSPHRRSKHYRSDSESSSDDYRRKRIKKEPIVKRESKSPTVVSICQDLLQLDRRLKLHRNTIAGLLNDAKDYEKKQKKEYLMTQQEYEFLFRTKVFLVNNMNLKWINKSMETKMRLVRFQLVIMIRRWEKFMKMNGQLEKAVAMRRAHERRSHEWHQKNRKGSAPNKSYNRISRSSSDTRNSSDYTSTSDYKSMDNSTLHSTPNTTKTDDDFTATLLKIKKEKAEQEIEELMEEKAILLKQMKEEEISPDESPRLDDSHDSQKLVIDEMHDWEKEEENAPENRESANETGYEESNDQTLIGDMDDIKLSATDISNDELIELFKDFETSSEAELDFVRQIMLEIENADKARFDYLKSVMEEIQNSFEKNDSIDYVRSLSPREAEEVLAKAENY